MLAPDRWLVGIEGPPDPVSGKRRRQTSVVNGTRDQAEVALARLKLMDADGHDQSATNARTVRAASRLYLSDAQTELQTRRTDRSACKRICTTVVPGGHVFGDTSLSKVDWKLIEQVYRKWEGDLQPPTRVRYASTLVEGPRSCQALRLDAPQPGTRSAAPEGTHAKARRATRRGGSRGTRRGSFAGLPHVRLRHGSRHHRLQAE